MGIPTAGMKGLNNPFAADDPGDGRSPAGKDLVLTEVAAENSSAALRYREIAIYVAGPPMLVGVVSRARYQTDSAVASARPVFPRPRCANAEATMS